MDKPTTKEVARFFDQVQITKHCWLWIAVVDKNGYGRFGVFGKHFQAHRFSYELFVGPIKSGYCVLHRRECGNRNCINPHHLYQGTHADNMRDMALWGNVARGEKIGISKLSEPDVLAIRRTYKEGSYCFREIADIYNISKTQARCIIRGIQWKHIPI